MSSSSSAKAVTAGLAVSAAFATVLATGAPAQAAPYCSAGANGTVCVRQTQPSDSGKLWSRVGQATTGPYNYAGAYDNPNWSAGYDACRRVSGATRSIRWVERRIVRPYSIYIKWDCYSAR